MLPHIQRIDEKEYPSHINKDTHTFTLAPKESYMWGHIKGIFPKAFKHEDPLRFRYLSSNAQSHIIASANTVLLLIDRNFPPQLRQGDNIENTLHNQFLLHLNHFKDNLTYQFEQYLQIANPNHIQIRRFMGRIERTALAFRRNAFFMEDNELAAEIILSEIAELRDILNGYKDSSDLVDERTLWRMTRVIELSNTNFGQYKDMSAPTTTDLINKGNSYNFFAHEIRTPLNTATLYQAILSKYTDFTRVVAIDHILFAWQSVSNLLTCLKDRDNMLERGTTVVDVPETVLGFVAEWLKSSFPRFTITTAVPDEPVFSNLNTFGLRIALKELIRNAKKYSGIPKVALKITLVNGDISISVRDFGTILLSDPTNVFQAGVRDASNSSTDSGTGMGLFGVSNYASVHGGSVTFTEKFEGEKKVGSEVTIIIPQY